MTIMRVSLVETPLSAEQKQRFASRLIETFAKVEVGQESPSTPSAECERMERSLR